MQLKYSKIIKRESEDVSRNRRMRVTKGVQKKVGRTLSGQTLQKSISQYRWWFRYLKLALELQLHDVSFVEYEMREDKRKKQSGKSRSSLYRKELSHRVVVDEGVYVDWDLQQVLEVSFDRWWKTHRQLFMEREAVEITSDNDIVFDDNSRYIRIDRRRTVVDTIREIRGLISDQEQSRGRDSTSDWSITGEMREEVLFNVYNTIVMKEEGMTATQILSKTQYFKDSKNRQTGLFYDSEGDIDHQRNSQKIRDYRHKGNCLILTVADGYFQRHKKGREFFKRSPNSKILQKKLRKDHLTKFGEMR